jgi:GTP-binding protein
VIIAELAKFNDELLRKPMIVVATKIDMCSDPERIAAVKRKADERHSPFFAISSATGKGLEELRYAMGALLFPAHETAEVPVGS